jgi:TRAP-type mannitol/chloroaromatic compound transport system permease small subunit
MDETSESIPGRPPPDGGRRGAPFGWLTAGLSGIGTVWIFALILLINADVLGRFLFSRPVTGVPELVSLSIVGIVFLQLTHTLRMERFIRSDVLIARLIRARPRIGFALQAVHHAFGVALLAAIFHFALPKFHEAIDYGEYIGAYGVFQAPTWPIWLVVLIGSGLSVLQFLLHILRDLRVATGAIPAPEIQTHESDL